MGCFKQAGCHGGPPCCSGLAAAGSPEAATADS